MQLLTKSFFIMFDPHRTRYNDRRFFTRKGQILQAKKVDPPFSIEPRKVEAYKQYLLLNHLIQAEEIPYYHPPGPTKITIDAVSTSRLQEPFPTNNFGYTEEGLVNYDISGFNPPRIVITVKETQSDYQVIIFMYGDMTGVNVDARSYYVFFGLGDTATDYDIKFLSHGQTALSFQDQVDQPDNTTFLLPKSKYTIVLPA